MGPARLKPRWKHCCHAVELRGRALSCRQCCAGLALRSCRALVDACVHEQVCGVRQSTVLLLRSCLPASLPPAALSRRPSCSLLLSCSCACDQGVARSAPRGLRAQSFWRMSAEQALYGASVLEQAEEEDALEEDQADVWVSAAGDACDAGDIAVAQEDMAPADVLGRIEEFVAEYLQELTASRCLPPLRMAARSRRNAEFADQVRSLAEELFGCCAPQRVHAHVQRCCPAAAAAARRAPAQWPSWASACRRGACWPTRQQGRCPTCEVRSCCHAWLQANGGKGGDARRTGAPLLAPATNRPCTCSPCAQCLPCCTPCTSCCARAAPPRSATSTTACCARRSSPRPAT